MKELPTQLAKHIPVLINTWRSEQHDSPRLHKEPFLNKQELHTVSQALLALQRGLTGDRQLAGAGYMQKAHFLGAYLLYYWPVTYMQLSYILGDSKAIYTAIAKKVQEEKRPLRILDIGSGPGPAACAIIDAVQPYATHIELTLLDSSSKALTLAQKLLQNMYKQHTQQLNIHTQPLVLDKTTTDPLQQLQEHYDIICMSHVLNELWKNATPTVRLQNCTAYCKQVVSHLSPEGIYIINEPALLATSRFLLEVRNALCHDGMHVIAPCTSDDACPVITAGASHTCHAEIPWKAPNPIAALAHGAGLDRTSVKMSYCIFQHGVEQIKKEVRTEQDNSDAVITARVVSEGMLNKSGRIRFLLCTGNKRIPLSAKKADPIALAQQFFDLQRYDMITLQHPEIRDTGQSDTKSYGISPQTTLRVITRMGQC